jgi:hypothetical protein
VKLGLLVRIGFAATSNTRLCTARNPVAVQVSNDRSRVCEDLDFVS